MSECQYLPEINGFKIIKYTDEFKRNNRLVIAECKLCFNSYKTQIRYLRKANSCGCAWKTPGVPRRLQHTYAQMKTRCENSNHPAFQLYGAVGITICDEWQDSKKFYEWALSNGYKSNLSIDRIDNYKGYSPDNCRWATLAEQQRNRKISRFKEADVRYIRANPDNLSRKHLAYKYDCNEGAICRIINQTRFKDII